MRPFTGTKCHKHLENWSFCTNTFNFLHVPTLDDFTWNLQSCFADLFHPVIFKSMTALFYSFPELPPSCFRASSAAAHTCSFTMAILAEPFHLSCLKSPAGSSSIISGSLSGLLGSCPSQISFPTHGSSIAQIHSQQILLWVPCPTFALAMSDTPQKTSVLQHWEFVPSSVHSKKKLLLQLHQLTGREQGKFVKLTRLTLKTALQKYFSLQMF